MLPNFYKQVVSTYARNKEDKTVLCDTIRKQGYTRPYKSKVINLKRLVGEDEKTKQSKYNPKLYKKADYPGEKIQVDVKFVPSYCVANGDKYYQYTAIDECTRCCFREMYDEHSTYSTLDFLKN